ncbi:MAG: flavodoxin domain-containing protein [Chloroflexi bacterium]|nr:flavodoxin domain-containing protein [Chloroflexota bacterium]
MSRILVTYATRLGSTAEVADLIATVLGGEGRQVEVQPIESIQHVKDYDAVVVGSAIRGGKWLPHAVEFLEKHQAALAQKPLAYFTVCMTMADDSPESHEVAESYHDVLFRSYPSLQPMSIGMFAGAFDSGKVSPLIKLLARGMGIPEGDWRDWESISDWARDLSLALSASLEMERASAQG